MDDEWYEPNLIPPLKPDMWHRPQPGPVHWDWRCLVCSEAVSVHPSWWARVKHRRAVRRATNHADRSQA